MSPELQGSTRSATTVVAVTGHAAEIESLLTGAVPELVAADPTVEDVSVFALEKHLEDFLVANWASTELGKGYRIYEVDGERVGQQFPTDTGPIDILAISHDGTELLVVELKRGRASDSVVGQIQRYMGYVAQDLAEPSQRVRGVIVALEDDLRVRRALAVAPNIDFYRYTVQFSLHKA
jgi:restriction system protein